MKRIYKLPVAWTRRHIKATRMSRRGALSHIVCLGRFLLTSAVTETRQVNLQVNSQQSTLLSRLPIICTQSGLLFWRKLHYWWRGKRMKFSGRLRSINEPRLIRLIAPKLLLMQKTDIRVVFIFLSVIFEKNV